MVDIDPIYADAIAVQNGEKRSSGPKLPSVSFKNIGDKLDATVVRVGDSFFADKEWKGDKRRVLTQVFELKDITIVYASDDDDVPPVVETIPAANLWLQKTGHFAAIGIALKAAELAAVPEGANLKFKWSGLGQAVGDGARPHKFAAKITPQG